MSTNKWKEAKAKRRAAAKVKRAAAAECWLCGQKGHTRRECPGVYDDGKGQSIHRGKPGPKGNKKKSKGKGARGQWRGTRSDEMERELVDPLQVVLPGEGNDDCHFFDCFCDIAGLSARASGESGPF